MSSGATGLAGRYASALYALAVDSNKVVSIHAELGSLETMLIENQDLNIAELKIKRDKSLIEILKTKKANNL